jgi:hypothetical protein
VHTFRVIIASATIAFLRRFARFDRVFSYFDFATEFFFLQSKVIGLVANPQPGGPGTCIYVTFYIYMWVMAYYG